MFKRQGRYSNSSGKVAEYLMRYGYLETTQRTEGALKEALKIFQMVYRLPVSGIFDTQTKEFMSRPRCGNKDPVDEFKKHINSRANKEYVLHGTKWTNYKLTYKIVQYSNKLDRAKTLSEMKEAFKTYSAVTPLRFIEVTDRSRKVHFDISFETRLHCCHKGGIPDLEKFDGKGNILAHGAYPERGGDIHFDDDDDFELGNATPKVASFRYVFLHELGHVLGLEHNWDLGSLMFAYDFGKVSNRWTLDKSTIDGVRVMYGNQSIILP